MGVDTDTVAVATSPGGASHELALAVFEHHPHGIIVVDPYGRVIAHNTAARALLGCAGEELGPRATKALGRILDAHVAEDPPHDASLVQRALADGARLPEIRFDLPAGCGAEATWVTAAPLGGEGRVIVELRPGRGRDRRRRTDPHWTRGPALRITTLGRTRVQSPQGAIDSRWLATRAGQLLKLLVAERERVVPSDEIVERLWADASIRSVHGVRYFIHALRDRLEPGRAPRVPSSFVRWTGGGYVLERAHVHVDADEFEARIGAGMARLPDDPVGARAGLEGGLALYGGDFLADEPYAEWAIPERDRLRTLAGEALRALAAIKRDHGDLVGAGVELERLVGLEPYDVDIHRELIEITLRRGRRTEAVRRYEVLRRRMLETFGEELDFTLADLAVDPFGG